MASRVITQLISDLSGDEIPEGGGETVEFTYRGAAYQIDLTKKEVAGFDKSIAMYLEHATKLSGIRRAARQPSSSGAKGDAKAIREWAREQGLDVPERGRIPAGVREQYEASH